MNKYKQYIDSNEWEFIPYEQSIMQKGGPTKINPIKNGQYDLKYANPELLQAVKKWDELSATNKPISEDDYNKIVSVFKKNNVPGEKERNFQFLRTTQTKSSNPKQQTKKNNELIGYGTKQEYDKLKSDKTLEEVFAPGGGKTLGFRKKPVQPVVYQPPQKNSFYTNTSSTPNSKGQFLVRDQKPVIISKLRPERGYRQIDVPINLQGRELLPTNPLSTPENWEKSIRDIEHKIGDPSKWTMDGYNMLQNKLNEYKSWRENTPEGQAVVDSHNEPNEYVVPLPNHLKQNTTPTKTKYSATWMDNNQASQQQTQYFNTQEEWKQFVENNPQFNWRSKEEGKDYSSATGFKMQKGGQLPTYQLGKASTSDSLEVYNNSVAIRNYYDNLRKKGWYNEPQVEKLYLLEKDFFKNSMEDVKNSSLKTYRDELSQDKPPHFKYFKNVYPKATINDYKKLIAKSLVQTKAGTGDKYYYKDLYPSIIDPMAPSTLVNLKILPNEELTFRMLGDRTKTNQTPPGGSITALYTYNPFSIKPYVLRTPKEKIEWEELYGNKQKPVATPIKKTLPPPKKVIKKLVPPSTIQPKLPAFATQPRPEPENFTESELPNIPQYEMQGRTPIYGPGNSLLGMLGNDNTFYPDYNNTAARTKINQADNDMIGNEEALRQLLKRKGVNNPIIQKFNSGGLIKRADGSYSKRGLWDTKNDWEIIG